MVSGHAEYAFGHHQNPTSRLGREGFGSVQLLHKAVHVVVRKHKTLSLVKANTIDHAGVAFAVVHNHIVTVDQSLNRTLAALVAVVEQESVFLLHELSQLLLELFMRLGLPTHDARAHGIAHAPILRSGGICLAYIRVIG